MKLCPFRIFFIEGADRMSQNLTMEILSVINFGFVII